MTNIGASVGDNSCRKRRWQSWLDHVHDSEVLVRVHAGRVDLKQSPVSYVKRSVGANSPLLSEISRDFQNRAEIGLDCSKSDNQELARTAVPAG